MGCEQTNINNNCISSNAAAYKYSFCVFLQWKHYGHTSLSLPLILTDSHTSSRAIVYKFSNYITVCV